MGAWATNNFGNDDACDWIYDLEKSKGTSLIEKSLSTVVEETDYLESPACCEALAAAEIVAASISGDEQNIPSEAKAWLNKKQGIFGKKPQITKEHALLAQKAIERIIENSELKELWEETEDYNDWCNTQSSLLKKLKIS